MYSIVTYHIGNMNVNWAAYDISRSIRGNLQKKNSIFKDNIGKVLLSHSLLLLKVSFRLLV